MQETSRKPIERADLWEWVLTILLGGNLVWTTLCLGGYRPETMLITSLLTAATLMVQLLVGMVQGRSVVGHWAGWLFVPFLLYAAVNVLWFTPVQWLGWHDWFFWANVWGFFWVVLNGVRHPATRAVLLGCVGALVVAATIMACYQRFVRPEWLMLGREQADQFLTRSSGPFGIPNSLAAFYLLVLPVLLGLTVRRRATLVQRVLFGYITLCAGLGLFLTVSRGGWMALFLAFTGWPLLAGSGVWWRRALVALALAAGLLLVGWGLYSFNPAVKARFDTSIAESGEWTRRIMWRGAWQLFQESPIWGTGAGSYNVRFEKYRPENYQMEPRWAHNEYLNTLSDYGVVGLVLSFGVGAGMLVILVKRIHVLRVEAQQKPPRQERTWLPAALLIGLLAFSLQLFVDFHFKIPALGMLFALSAALLINTVLPQRRFTNNRGAWWGGGAAVAVALGAVLLIYPHYQAEALRYANRQAVDNLWRHEPTTVIYRATLERARMDLARSCEIDPTNAQAWSDRALVASLWSHLEPSAAVALGLQGEVWANRALALSPTVAEFWIRRGVALDMQGKWLEAGNDMIEALSRAPANAQVWFYQAHHLSLKPSTRALALAAYDYCLRLDPANVTAQRLRQKLATSQ